MIKGTVRYEEGFKPVKDAKNGTVTVIIRTWPKRAAQRLLVRSARRASCKQRDGSALVYTGKGEGKDKIRN
jgi:hypothetical protein